MEVTVGRFAPSPSGRMHLGNIFAALMSWVSARAAGGRWIVRIEDLDPQRSKAEYAGLILDDLAWLGLDCDEGGIDDTGPSAPYRQSGRHKLYEAALARLDASGLIYPCHCTRAELRASQAPHAGDGHIIYPGTCRNRRGEPLDGASARLTVPATLITHEDIICGTQSVNLAREFGDIVLRRADGAWAYQLAVTVDDALMGVTEVVRGNDLLQSAAMQIHLHRLLGHTPPRYAHLPLLRNAAGLRLSKRDASLAMDMLRLEYTPERLTGHIAALTGLIPAGKAITPHDLADILAGRSAATGLHPLAPLAATTPSLTIG